MGQDSCDSPKPQARRGHERRHRGLDLVHRVVELVSPSATKPSQDEED